MKWSSIWPGACDSGVWSCILLWKEQTKVDHFCNFFLDVAKCCGGFLWILNSFHMSGYVLCIEIPEPNRWWITPWKGSLGFRYFTYFYTRSCSTWLTMLLGGLADKANQESRNCWEIRYVVRTSSRQCFWWNIWSSSLLILHQDNLLKPYACVSQLN